MDNHDDKRLQLLLGILIRKGAASPLESTDQFLHPWRRLAAHLRPLIGESGFCALFSRGIRLTAAQFDWLVASQPGKSSEAAVGALGEAFAAADAASARAANAALLNTFANLLSDLIGDALTFRILDSASNGEDEQNNAQEHK
jgi:hypothetical protein